jgi:metal-responsive CopG/Arc/MetJ family transcriptional regulator
MKKNYDFSGGRRGAVLKLPAGKTRITIRLDSDLLQWFRDQVHGAGGGNYQSLINAALREYMEGRSQRIADMLRMVMREEFERYDAQGPPASGGPGTNRKGAAGPRARKALR